MRYFKLLNPLTLPRTLKPGMGNLHARPAAGDVVAIPSDACARQSRFVRGRIRAKDMIEITEAEFTAVMASAAKVAPVAKPASSPIVTAKPTNEPALPAKGK